MENKTETVIKIAEGRELIAQFMGVSETTGYYDSYGMQMPHYYTRFGEYRTRSYSNPNESMAEFLHEANYNTSWDWLMPVIKKVSDNLSYDWYMDNIVDHLLNNNIERAFEITVDSIKTHNESDGGNF